MLDRAGSTPHPPQAKEQPISQADSATESKLKGQNVSQHGKQAGKREATAQSRSVKESLIPK